MKKIVLGFVLGVALAVFAEEIALKWEFFGYAENIAADVETVQSATVDATLAVAAEAELEVDSFPLGMTIFLK